MRHASFIRRSLAVFAAVVLVGATLVPEDADARAGRGGSFGSRGARTFDAAPPTATAPGAAPMQRSITQPGQPGGFQNNPASQAGRPAQAPSRGLFGGGLGAGLMGGLLGAGLFGLLSGSGLFGGLGSLSSILGLVIQLALIFFAAKLIMGWWRRRQQPQTAAVSGPSPYAMGRPEPQTAARDGFSYGGSSGASGFGAGSAQATRGEDIELEAQDFDVFERLLGEVQDAWSKQDLSRLRGLATPEMVEMFGEDLAADASRGVVNKVSGVKLLQGDLAESWRERDRDYATVAMRYELIDVTEDRDSGRVVDGDPHASQEAAELWTFVRAHDGGRWLLSAIQQAG